MSLSVPFIAFSYFLPWMLMRCMSAQQPSWHHEVTSRKEKPRASWRYLPWHCSCQTNTSSPEPSHSFLFVESTVCSGFWDWEVSAMLTETNSKSRHYEPCPVCCDGLLNVPWYSVWPLTCVKTVSEKEILTCIKSCSQLKVMSCGLRNIIFEINELVCVNLL